MQFVNIDKPFESGSNKEKVIDPNPGFPVDAGRTPLAKVRNYLANRRSELSLYRTAMSRGRTGLAFLRTGIALVTISVTFFRLFGAGPFLPVDLVLAAAGLAAIVDGLLWYLPVRHADSRCECRH